MNNKTKVIDRYLDILKLSNKKRAEKIRNIWEKGMYPSLYIYCLIKVKQL